MYRILWRDGNNDRQGQYADVDVTSEAQAAWITAQTAEPGSILVGIANLDPPLDPQQ